MCTVLIVSQLHPEFPVVVAANRDELYARPAHPARVIQRDPVAVGGIDIESGGTWMGVTANGILVALTNQRPTVPFDRSLRSRGEIVMQALEKDSPDTIRDYIEQLDATAYNPFNLVFGDASGLTVAYVRRDPASIELEPVPAGVHVLPSDRLNCEELPRVARVRELARPHAQLPWPALREKFASALSDHSADRAFDAVCIHTELYGTRSAMMVALTEGQVAHCEFADGPLCRSELSDVRHLLES